MFFRFFTRVDRVLRRSLGVSETAPTDTRVKPAPPVNPVLEEEEPMEHHFEIPAEMKEKISLTMEEIDDEGSPIHDELWEFFSYLYIYQTAIIQG